MGELIIKEAIKPVNQESELDLNLKEHSTDKEVVITPAIQEQEVSLNVEDSTIVKESKPETEDPEVNLNNFVEAKNEDLNVYEQTSDEETSNTVIQEPETHLILEENL